MYRKPPRGYYQRQYPLPHEFNYDFELGCESALKDTTICTLIRTSKAGNDADTIEVHPNNAAFQVDAGPHILRNSIIPRMNVSLRMALTKGAIETDKIRELLVNWMPIYTAFLEPLDAVDDKTNDDVEQLIGLQHDTINEDVYPDFVGADLPTGTQPLSTVTDGEAFGDYGLTTNANLEPVLWSKEDFYDAMHYYQNRSMLKKVTGRMHTVKLNRDRHYSYFSRNYTYPSVKRGNPYTFCGILFNLPQGGDKDQLVRAADTTDISHVNIRLNVRYDEWNPLFEQEE